VGSPAPSELTQSVITLVLQKLEHSIATPTADDKLLLLGLSEHRGHLLGDVPASLLIALVLTVLTPNLARWKPREFQADQNTNNYPRRDQPQPPQQDHPQDRSLLRVEPRRK
jgi:hypothetical protein